MAWGRVLPDRRTSVAERQEVSMVFLPTSVRPSKNDPWTRCAALLLNPCDGFHLVYANFDGDGEFDRFSDFASSDPYADDFYVAWALLLDEVPLIYHFDPKRAPVSGVLASDETSLRRELRMLGFELEGVLQDLDHGGLQSFDEVCEQTVERVRIRLAQLACGVKGGAND